MDPGATCFYSAWARLALWSQSLCPVRQNPDSAICYALTDSVMSSAPTNCTGAFAPAANTAQDIMQQHLVRLVEENMARGETDNITAVLVRTC